MHMPKYYHEDEELWGITGLLHDLDYERYSDMDDTENGHPRTELRLFRERNYPTELIHAVEAHATFLGVPRESLLDKALLACDELTGLIQACAYVRPRSRYPQCQSKSRSRKSGKIKLSPRQLTVKKICSILKIFVFPLMSMSNVCSRQCKGSRKS